MKLGLFLLSVFFLVFFYSLLIFIALCHQTKQTFISQISEKVGPFHFLSIYSTTRQMGLSSRERRAISERGGCPKDWLPSRHGHGVPGEICLLFAVALVMALILCLHVFVA